MIYYSIQCSMCKAVLESGADQQVAESLNEGIAYLAAIPYILAGLSIFIIYTYSYPIVIITYMFTILVFL